MKLGFICPDLSGHLNPMSALARQLRARNHKVVFLYSSGAPAGLPFVPAPEQDHINENRPEMSKMEGQDALQFSFAGVGSNGDDIKVIARNCSGPRDRCPDNRYSSVLCRTGCAAPGHALCARCKCTALDYSGYTPLCVYGWPHKTTPAALARNREGVAQWANVLASASEGLKAHAESIGLRIDWQDLSSTVSPWASITQVPRAFDFESSHWPSAIPPHGSIP